MKIIIQYTQHQKIPIDLLPSQISNVAIEELVKPNAKNPGTVISTNIQHISYFDKSIFVSTYPLEAIKICHTNFFNINNNIITMIKMYIPQHYS
jgi:hypothetical protein